VKLFLTYTKLDIMINTTVCCWFLGVDNNQIIALIFYLCFAYFILSYSNYLSMTIMFKVIEVG